MPSFDVLLFRLLLVIVVGGLIGAEREYRNKSAGLRTMIFICLGSFLFTTFSIAIGSDSTDRIASNIVTGIGFIGGGVIFRGGSGINGITTAASIWVVAALGMGIADGYYSLVLVATAVVLASLFLLIYLEDWMGNIHQTHQYKITSRNTNEILSQFEALFTRHHLKYKRVKQTKTGQTFSGTWQLRGSKKAHSLFVKHMLEDASIQAFEF
jgi:putative Mg2+ transporter-C (MgtC) family protein